MGCCAGFRHYRAAADLLHGLTAENYIGRASKANAVGGRINSHSLIESTWAKRILALLTPSAINRSLPRTPISHGHPQHAGALGVAETLLPFGVFVSLVCTART